MESFRCRKWKFLKKEASFQYDVYVIFRFFQMCDVKTTTTPPWEPSVATVECCFLEWTSHIVLNSLSNILCTQLLFHRFTRKHLVSHIPRSIFPLPPFILFRHLMQTLFSNRRLAIVTQLATLWIYVFFLKRSLPLFSFPLFRFPDHQLGKYM